MLAPAHITKGNNMQTYETTPAMVTTEQIKRTAHCIAEAIHDEHLIVDMVIEMMSYPFRDVMEGKLDQAMQIHHQSSHNYKDTHEPL